MIVTDFTTLTFDCYGTLIDWERGIAEALAPWTRRHGRAFSDEAIVAAFGACETARQSANPAMPYPKILAAVMRDLAGRWDIPVSDSEAADFGASVKDWPAFADSVDALAYLKRHYKLVIVSNVDHASFAHSNRRLGVTFDAVVTAEDVGRYKPDPENFSYLLNVLAGMGVAKDDILHTAQSQYHDMGPARAVGLATLWVNRRKGSDGWGATPPPAELVIPDIEVASMADVVALHRAAI